MSKILFVRSTPYEEDMNSYNVQGIGIAKAFCKLGYDCDYLNFTKKNEHIVELLSVNGHHARAIYKHRIRVFRTGISLSSLSNRFLSNYDYIVCREYNQIMTHLIAKRHHNTSMYSGPYWNMFMIPFFSFIYDLLYTKKLNKELSCKFVKSQLAKEFLEKKGYTDLIDVGVGLDVERFDNIKCSESTRRVADYMEKNKCLLYVGSIDTNKNVSFIINVFTKVLEKDRDVKLILIGKSHQSLIKKLLGKKDSSFYDELIINLPEKVKESIIHIERVENPQLQFIYPLAKAFLLPSIHEIFGMVLLEAMFFGAPVDPQA